MIDEGKIRYNGEWNQQNGLTFSFPNNGKTVNFLIETIGDRKRKILITMEPDINHGQPHIHINRHSVSISIKAGDIIVGECDGKTYRFVRTWIERHREDLLHLWYLAKTGKGCDTEIKNIRRDKSFSEFGFKGNEPKNRKEIKDVIIWYDGDLTIDDKIEVPMTIICDGDMFVGMIEGYKEGSMIFRSLNGTVQKKRPYQ